jgi:hypothetical protein
LKAMITGSELMGAPTFINSGPMPTLCIARK